MATSSMPRSRLARRSAAHGGRNRQKSRPNWWRTRSSRCAASRCGSGSARMAAPGCQRMGFTSVYSDWMESFLTSARFEPVRQLIGSDARIATNEKDGVVFNRYANLPGSFRPDLPWHTDCLRDVLLQRQDAGPDAERGPAPRPHPAGRRRAAAAPRHPYPGPLVDPVPQDPLCQQPARPQRNHGGDLARRPDGARRPHVASGAGIPLRGHAQPAPQHVHPLRHRQLPAPRTRRAKPCSTCACSTRW